MLKPKTMEGARRCTLEFIRIRDMERRIRDTIEARLLKGGHEGKYVCFAVHNTAGADDFVMADTPEEVLEKAENEYGDERPYSGFRVMAARSDIFLSSLGDQWW